MTISLIPSETSILRKNITWIFILFLGIILKRLTNTFLNHPLE